MISKIEINDIATFRGRQTLDNFEKFNYFFGANATGKTTLSRIIDSPEKYSSCSITWDNQVQLETRVYNRNFIVRNFNQQIPGVFTLGETTQNLIENIRKTKEDIATYNNEINQLNIILHGLDNNGGKRAEQLKLKQTFKVKFYRMKQRYSNTLSGKVSGEGLKGFVGSQDRFMNKVLLESVKNNALLLTQSQLEEKARIIFSNALETVPLLDETSLSDLSRQILVHEKNPILLKRIVGKNDVDISEMISKLNNIDWIQQGRSYYEINNGVCPFCQQHTNKSLHDSLSEYFDETFIKETNAIKTLADSYTSDAQHLQHQIQSLINVGSNFLDMEKITTEKKLLDAIIIMNKQKTVEKQKQSSQVFTLEPLENILTRILGIVVSANIKIIENNRLVQDLQNEKAMLTAQIWRFVLSELSTEIVTYTQLHDNLECTINNIQRQIVFKTQKISEKEATLRALEKQTTSTIPTKDRMNQLLATFGFKNFRLALGDEQNTYKLIREDGRDAKNTLSEGERNFLTFLYFYHLLNGSQHDTGFSSDKIVVIDDPISSLDNDVLFIVSTLVRTLIQDVRENKNSVKQIFILTHNIYFHKEVTYNRNRKDEALSEESFWLIKKNGTVSIVEQQHTNPIKTSYELLWDEIRHPNRNNATIHNTLRHILKSYFKLSGGIILDTLYEKFEGENKMKCKALCSWIDDRSYSAFEEVFYTPLDARMIKTFLDVFVQIFKETGHISHYNMMMGITPGL